MVQTFPALPSGDTPGATGAAAGAVATGAGTPFPTLYYLTCPRAASAIGGLESSGLMARMTERLKTDQQLAAAYRRAHEAYLAQRESLGHVAHIANVSAGGMPTRVKCLHALVGHALAVGPGVNPFGDEALAMLAPWWTAGPCVSAEPGVVAGPAASAEPA